MVLRNTPVVSSDDTETSDHSFVGGDVDTVENVCKEEKHQILEFFPLLRTKDTVRQ